MHTHPRVRRCVWSVPYVCMYVCICMYIFFLVSVPENFYCIFNATHYEFDIDVNTPSGTCLFEAILFIENPANVTLVLIERRGPASSSFLINGSDIVFSNNPTESLLLCISFSDEITAFENGTVCEFQLEALVQGSQNEQKMIDVILHKQGKHVCIDKGEGEYFNNTNHYRSFNIRT